MIENVINFIREVYPNKDFIALHVPKFIGKEKEYLNECIESTFVSSVGTFVTKFEKIIAEYTGAKYAVATNSGTSALHLSLVLAGVDKECEVITQPLTFIATCNAISYCNASPIFIDVDLDTMGLSPVSLKYFLKKNTIIKNKKCLNKKTNKIIQACVPMHTYGHPCRVDEIKKICDENYITLVEDAAESLGSFYKNRHTGTFGQLGAISFNGNKIITSGGGGCIITNDFNLAKTAKHLSTTAKISHKWEFYHDVIGYNYRMPNLNAALLVAQLENLNKFIINKRDLAKKYEAFFNSTELNFFKEPENSRSNYWLNSIVFKDKIQRDQFLNNTNANGVMTRPAWDLMSTLPMFKDKECGDLKNSVWLSERVVNIPSSVTL